MKKNEPQSGKKGAKADQGRKLMRATSTKTPAVENDKVTGLLKKDKGQERKSLRVTFQIDEGANSDPASSSKTKTSDIDEDMDESARFDCAKEYIDGLFDNFEVPYDQL